MSGSQFHETAMGREFYHATLPDLIGVLDDIKVQLKRIADSMQEEADTVDKIDDIGKQLSGIGDKLDNGEKG